MGLALVTTLAFCLWIVLWALGVKGVDGIMLTALVIVLAATLKSLVKYLPGLPPSSERRPSGGW
jgi:hypothetical protein